MWRVKLSVETAAEDSNRERWALRSVTMGTSDSKIRLIEIGLKGRDFWRQCKEEGDRQLAKPQREA